MDALYRNKLSIYADKLTETSEDTQRAEAYRYTNPQQFTHLCKFHLSLLVDLPMHFTDYIPPGSGGPTEQPQHNHAQTGQRRLFASFFRKESLNGRETCVPDVSKVYQNLTRLMDFLEKSDQLKTEGIFRKTGSIARQREISRQILTTTDLVFPIVPPKTPGPIAQGRETFNVHDYASTLKNFLTVMEEPLLTEKLLPVFVSVAELTMGNVDKNGKRRPLQPMDLRIAKAKQLQALRLLRLLLPNQNQTFLKRFLDLLSKTLENRNFNRMDANNLGTIIGPVLFTPADICPEYLKQHHSYLRCLATLIIEQGSKGVFAIPKTLVDDIEMNMEIGDLETASTMYRNVREVDEIYTSIKFTPRIHTERSSDTEYAVAELFAAVHSLPDTDPQKIRFMSRYRNHRPGVGDNSPFLVPGSQPQSSACAKVVTATTRLQCSFGSHFRKMKRAVANSPHRTPTKKTLGDASARECCAVRDTDRETPTTGTFAHAANLRSILKNLQPNINTTLHVIR